jgi:ABC-type transporter Mla subunit MlaD
MKVILTNGTSFTLGNYTKIKTTLNGDIVDAVVLQLTDTTLSAVKKAFADESSLVTLSIHDDGDSRNDIPASDVSLNGYQTKISIALGSEDDEFVVTLAQQNDTSAKIATLSADVSSLATSVESALKIFTELRDTTQTYLDTLNAAVDKSDKATEAVAAQANTIAELTANAQTLSNNVTDALAKVADAKATYEDGVKAMTLVKEGNEGLQSSINEAINQVTELINSSDLMTNKFNERVESFDSIRSAMDTLHESVNATNIATDETKNLVKNFESSIEEFGNTVDANNTAIKDAKQLVSDVKEANATLEEKINTTATTVEKQGTTISETANTLATYKETADKLDERVKALEPVTDITTLSLADAKQARITESQTALATWLENNPIESTCHGGVAAKYSITAEKQAYLQAMILITTMAATNNIPYSPSWNAKGQPCSYDWTLEELQELAMEIEEVVRPRISRQQAIEQEILKVSTMDELVAITFDFDNVESIPVPETTTTSTTTESN